MDAVVLFDYEKQQEDELDLAVGMTVLNVTQVDDGWCHGTFDGKSGMFPDNFVQLKPVSAAPPPVTKPGKPPPSDPAPSDPPVIARPAAQQNKSRRAKVTFSYAAENSDELTLQPGQTVNVIGEEEDGWWKGQVGERVGLFPSNFVEIIAEERTPPPPAQEPSHPALPPPHDRPPPHERALPPPHDRPPPHERALPPPHDRPPPHERALPPPHDRPPPHERAPPPPHDRPPPHERAPPPPNDTDGPPPLDKRPAPPPAGAAQLFPQGFNPGAIKLKKTAPPPAPPKEKDEPAKMKMPELRKAPQLPKSHPPPEPAKPPAPPPQDPVERAKVIFAYTSEQEDELSIQAGEILEVVDKKEQDGWWKVKRDGKVGLVPDNFVELLPAHAPAHVPATRQSSGAKEPALPSKPSGSHSPPHKREVKRPPQPAVHEPDDKSDFGVPPTQPLDSSVVKGRAQRPVGSVRPPSRSNLTLDEQPVGVAPWQAELKKRKKKEPVKTPLAPKPQPPAEPEKRPMPPRAASKPSLLADKPRPKPPLSKPAIDAVKPPVPPSTTSAAQRPTPPTTSAAQRPTPTPPATSAAQRPAPPPSQTPHAKLTAMPSKPSDPSPAPSEPPQSAGEWKEALEKLREEFEQFKSEIREEIQVLVDDLDRERKENASLKIDVDRLVKKSRL